MNPAQFFHARCLLRTLILLLLGGMLFSSCHYLSPTLDEEAMEEHTCDSLRFLYERHYTLDTNLELKTDSVFIACFPLKECYNVLYKGDRVVVAEFATHPEDSVETIWVKLAHSQEIQGWIEEGEMLRAFAPTDPISQVIYQFKQTHLSLFIFILALFIAAGLFRAVRRKQLPMLFFNDIDSLYPLFLCLLTAFCATIYESMQLFVPETWLHFYFNPTLSPFKVPLLLSLFLTGFWLFVVILLATIEESFHQLTPSTALFYLLGIASCCIFCYFFFLLTTRIYIGYLFLMLFIGYFGKKVYTSLSVSHYRCGRCGQRIATKGRCPHCGAINR